MDGLCFSRSPLLSVYADMSTCVEEYADADRSLAHAHWALHVECRASSCLSLARASLALAPPPCVRRSPPGRALGGAAAQCGEVYLT